MPAALDPTVPNVARMYDVMLGGKDNCDGDREAVRLCIDWRTGTPELRARQELMRAQGMPFIAELMDDLRVRHLGAAPVKRKGPGPFEQLEAAYQAMPAQKQGQPALSLAGHGRKPRGGPAPGKAPASRKLASRRPPSREYKKR